MLNLKLELFNFKKNLDFETQEDIARIAENHFNAIDHNSEKSIIKSLNERLSIHTYDKNVKSLLENLNSDLMTNELVYNLKDLYKVIESKNQGMIYRQVLNVILECINQNDDSDRMNKILNELVIHDWVNEIKTFVHNLQSNPQDRTNLLNGGKSEDLYTIVEQVENGHVALIKESWFFLSEDKIEKTLLENHINDAAKISLLRELQTALSLCEINEKRIDFKLNENIIVGISTDDNTTFINEDKLDSDTGISDLFASPLVPTIKKSFFTLIESVSKNKNKIVELDIVKHITNIGNPFIECFAFNYGDNMYLYRIDHRQGTSFYKYETATSIINDVKNELQHDLTHFFEDKLDSETRKIKNLEDKVREISVNLGEIEVNESKVREAIEELGESDVLSEALKTIERTKKSLLEDLEITKGLQSDIYAKEKTV